MTNTFSQKRYHFFLLTLGASILVFRTIKLLYFEEGLLKLALLPIFLTYVEMISDLTCIASSLTFIIKLKLVAKKTAIISGSFSTLLHFTRVLIYFLGRTTAFTDFDLKPQFRGAVLQSEFWPYFALILSIVGIIVLIFFLVIKLFKNKKESA